MIWVLTGFMGCGKTSIGRLAASLSAGLEFIDLDEEIVRREGRSIPDIFSADGETVFRSIERHTLADLLHAAGVPPEGRNTRGSIAGGPSRRDGGVSPKGELPKGECTRTKDSKVRDTGQWPGNGGCGGRRCYLRPCGKSH